jgi:hypothetical protein
MRKPLNGCRSGWSLDTACPYPGPTSDRRATIRRESTQCTVFCTQPRCHPRRSLAGSLLAGPFPSWRIANWQATCPQRACFAPRTTNRASLSEASRCSPPTPKVPSTDGQSVTNVAGKAAAVIHVSSILHSTSLTPWGANDFASAHPSRWIHGTVTEGSLRRSLQGHIHKHPGVAASPARVPIAVR